MGGNFQQLLFQELSNLLRPLTGAATDPQLVLELFDQLGWDVGAIAGLDLDSLQQILADFAVAYTTIEHFSSQPPESLDQLNQALMLVRKALQHIWDLPKLLPDVARPHGFDQLGQDLLEHLVVSYLQDFHPVFWQSAALLTVAERGDEFAPLVPMVMAADDTVLRRAHRRSRLRLDNVARLLSDPAGLLKSEYLAPTGLAASTDARQTARKLFGRLAALLYMMGAETLFGLDPNEGYDLGEAGNEIAAGLLTFAFPAGLNPAVDGFLGATLALSPGDEAGLGLVVSPFGILSVEQDLARWSLHLNLSAGLPAFALNKQGLTLPAGDTEGFDLLLRFVRLTSVGDPAVRLGSSTGTRLEIGMLALKGEMHLDEVRQDYGFLFDFGTAAIVITGGDGDGFLQKVLPEDDINISFDLATGWSKIRGLYFRGSAGLEATLPVHKDLLGVFKIDSVYLLIRAKDSNIETVVAATAALKLGPFTANVERIGLLAELAFPPSGGNLGLANLNLSFKPPDGAGMAIDETAVVGGGYLLFDKVNEQYAGILQLEVKGGISLKAIGLLTTRLPGLPPGVKGFSLLVIISAEFPPIQLGFGFTLIGVGGLLGVNRTMVLDVLRSGIKNHTLDSVLFPQDPVANAPQIISDLQSVFPPVTGQYVFGPMAKLAWGTPTILTVELGIVLEFPSPFRLAIMGQLRMVLPSEEVPEEFRVVVLRMDVLGTIDFDKGDASIDATLYDSRIAQYVISGDMAMRLNWGASPAFALSVGGFNPRFQPPPNFPSLDRLAIALATGDNPRIRLEAYLAVTTNTIQLGARLEVYAAYKFKLTTAEAFAYLSFDALLYLSPFSFIVDIEGYILVKVPPWPTISGWLYLSLSGPDPWHAQGGVTVEFFGKRHIPIDVKIGEEGPPPPLPPGDPLGDLRKALADTRNWSAQLPTDGHMLVTLRRIPISEASPEVLMHPFGELIFRQKVVPLDTPISKYGSTTPLNTGPFTITDVIFNDKTTEETRQTVRGLFAPGQFFEFSDDEKLSRPAFESLPSGCTGIGTSAFIYTDKSNAILTADFEYDTVVIDNKEELISRRGPGFEYAIAEDVLLAVAGLGAAGQSAMGTTGAAKFAGSTANRVQVKDAEYVVASKDTMKGEDPKPSYVEAEAGRRAKGAESGKYQIVGKHEVP